MRTNLRRECNLLPGAIQLLQTFFFQPLLLLLVCGFLWYLHWLHARISLKDRKTDTAVCLDLNKQTDANFERQRQNIFCLDMLQQLRHCLYISNFSRHVHNCSWR